MPFSFASHALVDSTLFSRFLFGVEDASEGMAPQKKANAEFLINAASQQIIDFVGRNLKRAQYSETWDGQESDMVIPREYPVVSVEAVKFSGNGDFASSNALPSHLVCFDTEAIYLRDVATPRGRGLVQITYTAGFEPVPYNVQLACLTQYQMLLRLSNPEGQGQGSADLGYSSISKMQETASKDAKLGEFGLCSEVVGLIKQYRRMDAPLSLMFTRVS